MRNINAPFYRTDEIGRESSKCPSWLDSFAEQMAINEQAQKSSATKGPSKLSSDIATAMEDILLAEQELNNGVIKRASKNAVEVARNRQESTPSIYEMMSAIVSGSKPKFSSVEEAVQDYKRRTGLSEYQRRNTAELFAEQIIQASEEEDVPDTVSEVDEWFNKGIHDKANVNGVQIHLDTNPEDGCNYLYLPDSIGDDLVDVGSDDSKAQKFFEVAKLLASKGQSASKIIKQLAKRFDLETSTMGFDPRSGQRTDKDMMNANDCASQSTGMGGSFVGSDVGDATVSATIKCKHCAKKIPMLEKEEHMIMTHPTEYMVEKGIKDKHDGPHIHRSTNPDLDPEMARSLEGWSMANKRDEGKPEKILYDYPFENEDAAEVNDTKICFNPQPEPPGDKHLGSEAFDNVFAQFLSNIGSSKKKFF